MLRPPARAASAANPPSLFFLYPLSYLYALSYSLYRLSYTLYALSYTLYPPSYSLYHLS